MTDTTEQAPRAVNATALTHEAVQAAYALRRAIPKENFVQVELINTIVHRLEAARTAMISAKRTIIADLERL